MTTRRAMRSRRTARSTVALAGAVTLAGAALMSAGPAQAAVGDLTCTASAMGTFTPPLSPSNTTSTVNVTGTLTNCVSVNGNFSHLQSATAEASGSATASGPFALQCPALLTLNMKGTFTWQNGQKSKFTGTFNTDITNGTATFSGTITSGPMKGDAISVAPTVSPNADCATAGLKSLTAPVSAVNFA
ncbi:hypothetical protein [Streptomyces syringium]|uniref:hypothetical protein n=1 Tax=Streptomyces syringium TaxID=76729 RepID=UPI00345602DD